MHARRSLGLLFILTLASCTETTGANFSGVPGYLISSVRVSPSVDTIFVPDSIRDSDRITFSATAIGKNGSVLPAMTFAWSTSNPQVATVDSAGVVTPRALGVVEISASADKVGRAMLVILPATMSVSIPRGGHDPGDPPDGFSGSANGHFASAIVHVVAAGSGFN